MQAFAHTHTKKNTLVLDAGTTAIKAFVFDQEENLIGHASQDIEKSFPQPGWVEQNPAEIVGITIQVLRDALAVSNIEPTSIKGLGIATQRETIVAWDKKTSEPVYPAIVWQDTRTASECAKLHQAHNQTIREKTGLSVDPYFSATKIRWILDNVPKAQELASNNQLAVGTIDSWLLWNLTQGSSHQTDYTNASRTLLFNIRTLTWDKELLDIFSVPVDVLPEAKPSRSSFGIVRKGSIGIELPILAVAGDQQAGLYAAGTEIKTTKATYGTGTFVMQVIGSQFALHHPFFTTLAIHNNKPWYALEAKVTSGVKNADAILQDPILLQSHIQQLVHHANTAIQQFPLTPDEIVIDGGWIRDGKILPMQSELSNIPVREQPIFDGTALGIHRIMQQAI